MSVSWTVRQPDKQMASVPDIHTITPYQTTSQSDGQTGRLIDIQRPDGQMVKQADL